MDLKLECFDAYCALKEFEINGIEATYEEFGTKSDLDPDNAEDYGCGDMTFVPKLPTKEILKKYGIDLDEYSEICEKLECLSFGYCSWCV